MNTTLHHLVTALLLAAALPLVAATTAPLQPLNDTGIRFGGNYPYGNNTTCTGETIAQQDCQQGRDADPATHSNSDGHAGFSFTKLGANGTALAIQNGTYSETGSEEAGTKWSCVKDNVTGLMWEMKTDDGGIHDKDNTYRWGGKTARIQEGVTYGTRYNDWDTLVDGANGQNFCGFSDWRVPSKEELRSIVNYNIPWPGPMIDTTYFPNMRAATGFWSSSPDANNSGQAWRLNFHLGDDDTNNRTGLWPVRLVRAGHSFGLLSSETAQGGTCPTGVMATAPNSRYSIQSDGTVTDLQTGLMWKQCSEGQSGASCSGTAKEFTWQGALQQPATLNVSGGFAGYTDWQLPNVKELASLTEEACYGPAINRTAFPNTSTSSDYWSSSPHAYHTYFAWILDFDNGHDYYHVRTSSYPVRLVRAGHSFGLLLGNSPTVSAGTAQTVTEQSAVTLSGSATDSDGTISRYQWTQTSGPTVTLTNATSTTARFTAPSVTANTVLSFTLIVTDNSGASSSSSVTVTVMNTSADNDRQTFNLTEGWNLVSLTHQPTDPTLTVAQAFTDPAILRVIAYRADGWHRYEVPNQRGSLGSLPLIELIQQGLWIETTQATTLTLTGIPQTFLPSRLHAGWNLIGLGAESLTPATFATQFNSTVWPTRRLYTHTGGQWTPHSLTTTTDNQTPISVGEGVWLYLE